MRQSLTVLAGAIGALVLGVSPSLATEFVVDPVQVRDRKAVFATVQSVDTVMARARLGGTIGELRVDEGDQVEAQQVIAVVIDDQLAPQIGALNAQVAGLRVQLDQARADLARDEDLFARGLVADARLEASRTQVSVLENQVASARQQRAVTVQRAREGDVLAPASGVVLSVPITAGSVVLPGEGIAQIGSDQFVLRLALPERHARFLRLGDAVELEQDGVAQARQGVIRQVYPQIQSGQITADAVVEGLGDYFVGERVQVWIYTEPRTVLTIPQGYIETRFGLDYVRVRQPDGAFQSVVVQRGGPQVIEGDVQHVEILSGLMAGDVLVQP